MSATLKGKAMCCLTIGCHDYLLPMDAGMKVMQLLSGAVAVDHDYNAGDIFVVQGELQRMRIMPVTQRQIRWPADAIGPEPPKRQRRLALPGPR